MKLLGSHMSIEGGIHRSLERGADVGCDAIQLFTRSSHQWRARPLADEEVSAFRRLLDGDGPSPAVAHACYLINMASPDPDLWRRSVATLREEIDRCAVLGLPYLIIHPGAHMGAGLEAATARIASALETAFGDRPDSPTMVLLETTAGMGSSVGHRFEQIQAVRERLARPERTGVCVDTCHLFAAGYDMSTEGGYESVVAEMERVLGLGSVRAFHLNDCKGELGCRVDRHEHIGNGRLGVTAFWCLLNDPRFEGLPMILETPKGRDLAEDRTNLALLRAQVGSPAPVTGPRVRVTVPGKKRGRRVVKEAKRRAKATRRRR